MRQFILLSSAFLFTFVILSCGSVKKAENMKSSQNVLVPGPKAIIYLTREDYSKLVPVILSDDKKTIESYPDVKDIYFNGSLAYPTQLHKGYWLDNRGIGENVAFLKLTYEEYSKLSKTPSPEELMKMILDADPIVIMYNCGLRSSYQNIGKELNTKLDTDDFSTFLKIK
ncbi:MAG: hypothetical protein Q7U54_14540 [Bacteroidales bacterium]|nr:hypothetical protein [Bacteroidales bacterium]